MTSNGRNGGGCKGHVGSRGLDGGRGVVASSDTVVCGETLYTLEPEALVCRLDFRRGIHVDMPPKEVV